MKLPVVKRKNTNDVITNTGKVSKQKLCFYVHHSKVVINLGSWNQVEVD